MSASSSEDAQPGQEDDNSANGPASPITGGEFHIPFGHFVGSGGGSEHGQDLFVGRISLRKHLIRQLVFGGRQLACLITGRRGMGKTSFVRYCLQEYEHNAFERFRRIPAGKSLPDYLVVCLFITLAAFASVIAAELASYAMSAGNRGGTKVLGAIIGAGCLIPLIFFFKYAWIVNSEPLAERGRSWRLVADMAIAATICIYDMRMSGTEQAALLLIYTLAPFTLIVAGKGLSLRGERSKRLVRRLLSGATPLTFIALFSHLILTIFASLRHDSIGTPDAVAIAWPIGLVSLTVVNLIRAEADTRPPPCNAAPWLILLLALVLAAILLPAEFRLMALPIVVCGGMPIAIGLWSPRKQPLPVDIVIAQSVVRTKTLLFLIFALELGLIAFGGNYPQLGERITDAWLILTLIAVSIIILILEFGLIAMSIGPYDPFARIIREMPGYQGDAPGSDPNPDLVYANADIKQWCRNLERQTFAWQIYRAYAQPIISWVNLGFDDLDHRSVIHGMLVSLRDQYRKKFVDWNSTQAMAIRFSGLILLACTTALVSDALFSMPVEGYQGNRVACVYSPRDDNAMGPIPALLCSTDRTWRDKVDETDRGQAKISEPARAGLVGTLISQKTILDKLIDTATAEQTSKKSADGESPPPPRHYDEMRADTTTVFKAIKDAVGNWADYRGSLLGEHVGGAFTAYCELEKNDESCPKQEQKRKEVSPQFSDEKKKEQVIAIWKDLSAIITTASEYPSYLPKVPNRAHMAGAEWKPGEMHYQSVQALSALYAIVLPIEVVRHKTGAGILKQLFSTKLVLDTIANQLAVARNNPAPKSMQEVREANRDKSHSTASLHIRVYHLVIALVIAFAARWLLLHFPVLPYRANLKRMEDLLEGLTARTIQGQRRHMWEPARWLQTLLGHNQDTLSVDRAPLDPRAIEAAFVSILQECAQSHWRMMGGRYLRFSLPAPEITFVFDEMDKLWAKSTFSPPAARDKEKDAKPQKDDKTAYLSVMQAGERLRAQRTSTLLSDLKRVISDSPARFIFVGGRLLHDEWLADMNSRSPLLTSIFDSEIYVSSLLTDTTEKHYKTRQKNRLDELIRQYLAGAHAVANQQLAIRGRENKQWVPWIPQRPERGMIFLSNLLRDDSPEALNLIVEERGNAPSGTPNREPSTRVCHEPWNHRLTIDLAYYLTYRSAGSPKRLREILAEMIRPGSHLGLDDERDFINLRPPVLLRVQFVADIYRHLANQLEGRLVLRDDKIALSAFFLTDYLFKFHRRAFRWNNIERMDELTHIHRAPDIRELLGEIIDHFRARYLHDVVNGMYTYRFRSEVAQEIEHISHYNETEMAAFNFTLDESQALKTSYNLALQEGKEDNLDIIAGLGELHEYDQDYDIACQYYNRALKIADEHFTRQYGETQLTAVLSATAPAMGRLGWSETILPIPLAWTLTRLRLMLQIGMTYEQSGNLERAEGEYVAAYELSRLYLDRHLSDERRTKDLAREVEISWMTPPAEGMKHASLLYQPLFALAWVAEKQWNDIDTSATAIEKGLAELKGCLPFVDSWTLKPSKAPEKVTHSSFALIISDLHSKAADLYFFKGRQTVAAKDIENYNRGGKQVTGSDSVEAKAGEATGDRPNGIQGYLLRAHFHYSMALHLMRLYIHHRIISSPAKFHTTPYRGNKTISGDSYPAFIYRATAGILNNMAENMLARSSPFSILKYKEEKRVAGNKNRTMAMEIKRWLASSNEYANCVDGQDNTNCVTYRVNGRSHIIFIDHIWYQVGKCAVEPQTPPPAPVKKSPLIDATMQEKVEAKGRRKSMTLDYKGRREAFERLQIALQFSLAAAEFRAEQGNYDDAAMEMLMVAHTACQYQWWIRTHGSHLLSGPLKHFGIETNGPAMANDFAKGRRYLTDVALDALSRAGRWLQLARQDRFSKADKVVVGNIIPPEAVTLACSLGLVCCGNNPDHEAIGEIRTLLTSWQVAPLERKIAEEEPAWIYFQQVLFECLRINRYPVFNRLHGLKVLLDSSLIGITSAPPTDWRAENQSMENWLGRLYDEFEVVFQRFGAPHLFSHAQIGQTAAYYALYRSSHTNDGKDASRRALSTVRRNAIFHLEKSIEMYTLGQAHYETMRKMYYLYDDFNDRRMHHARALEMAGWDVSVLLLDYLIDLHPEK